MWLLKKTKYSEKELKESCIKNDIISVNLMINNGVKNWREGFVAACYNDNVEIVNLMLNEGGKNMNCSIIFDGMIEVCYSGNIPLFKLLVKRGSGYFNLELSGNTQLQYLIWNSLLKRACFSGNIELVNLISNYLWLDYIKVNDWNGGFECACLAGHLEIVKLMIKKGAHSLNEGLEYAREKKHNEIVKFLTEDIVSYTNVFSST